MLGAATARFPPLVPVAASLPDRREQPSTAASDTEPPRSPAERAPRSPADEAEPSALTRIVEVVPDALRRALVALAAVAVLLAGALGLAGLRMRQIERRRRRTAADVGLLQSALLPVLPDRVGRAYVSAAYRPAAGPAAGGDFYDAFALDADRTCVIVGDVAGHGREALPLTASVRYTVRAYLETGVPPREALRLAGQVLDPQLRGRLVTVVAAVYDASTGCLTYACAGHPVPLRTAAGGSTHDTCASPPLGAGAPTGRRQAVVGLPPGTAACFYTDGLLDVRTSGGRLGPSGLQDHLQDLGDRSSARAVVDRVVSRSDGQPDDMAVVVLRAPDDAAAPPGEQVDELEVDARELAGPRPARFLRACGVAAGPARDALAAAAHAAGRDGAAVLAVRRRGSAAQVAVHPAGERLGVLRAWQARRGVAPTVPAG